MGPCGPCDRPSGRKRRCFVRFEEWLVSARPTDEEAARVAWDAAIQAASQLQPHCLTIEAEERAVAHPGDPDAMNKVVRDLRQSRRLEIWEPLKAAGLSAA